VAKTAYEAVVVAKADAEAAAEYSVQSKFATEVASLAKLSAEDSAGYADIANNFIELNLILKAVGKYSTESSKAAAKYSTEATKTAAKASAEAKVAAKAAVETAEIAKDLVAKAAANQKTSYTTIGAAFGFIGFLIIVIGVISWRK
jgi:23S rRNA maturation-related 3'-5' exoribonuclease YhaM